MAPNLCFCSYRPMLSMVQTYVLEQLNLCFCRQRPIILRHYTDETDEKRRYSTSARACFCHAQVPPFVVIFHRKFSLLPPPLLSRRPRSAAYPLPLGAPQQKTRHQARPMPPAERNGQSHLQLPVASNACCCATAIPQKKSCPHTESRTLWYFQKIHKSLINSKCCYNQGIFLIFLIWIRHINAVFSLLYAINRNKIGILPILLCIEINTLHIV